MNKPEFLMILTELMEDESVSNSAKYLHGLLLYWKDEDGFFRRSNNELATYFGKAKKTVMRWTRELEDAGYIRKEVIKQNGVVVERRIAIGKFMKGGSKKWNQVVPGNGTVNTRGNNTKVLYTPRINKRKSALPLTDDSQDQFEKAWNLYQYKIGKENAKKAWNKLSSTEQELALKAIPGYVERTVTSNHKYEKYESFKPQRCHFSTWLNGKRWEDEQLKVRQSDTGTTINSNSNTSNTDRVFKGVYGTIREPMPKVSQTRGRGRSK